MKAKLHRPPRVLLYHSGLILRAARIQGVQGSVLTLVIFNPLNKELPELGLSFIALVAQLHGPLI